MGLPRVTSRTVEDIWHWFPNEEEVSYDIFRSFALTRLGDIRHILADLGSEHDLGQPGYAVRSMGSSSRFVGMVGNTKVYSISGGHMTLPPLQQRASVDVMLGQINVSVENLIERFNEEREESRDRGRKIDAILARFGEIDTKINTLARDLDDKIKDQNRVSASLDERVTKALDDVNKRYSTAAEHVNAALALVSANIRNVEAEQHSSALKLGQLSVRSEDMQADQTELRKDVASVKRDTELLQRPVQQFVEMRRKLLAFVVFCTSVVLVVWWSVVHGIASFVTEYILSIFEKK